MSSENLLNTKNNAVRVKLTDNGLFLLEQHNRYFKPEQSSSFGFLCSSISTVKPSSTNEISLKNIIWCEHIPSEASDMLFEITYLLEGHNASIEKFPAFIEQIEGSSTSSLSSENVKNLILEKSYQNSQVSPSILFLANPKGGQGHAVRIYQEKILPVLKAANVRVSYQETKYRFHASDIARELDINQYDIIACCSGDGIPHEVINGFYERPDKGIAAFNKIAVTQLPCGSGNALSLSTHGSNNAIIATVKMLKAVRTKMDLMALTQGLGNRSNTRLSFLSQCYGIIADADIGTEHLRWMGSFRFELGIIQKVFARAKYPCDVYVKYHAKSKSEIELHYTTHLDSKQTGKAIDNSNLEAKYPDLSHDVPNDWVKLPSDSTDNLTIFYVGKLPYVSLDAQFFPAALPNDGCMDMITMDTNASILETAISLMSVDKGMHVEHPKVHHAKILAYRLIPKISQQNHYISVDGENFPFEPLQVEVLKDVLTCLLYDGKFVDTKYSSGQN